MGVAVKIGDRKRGVGAAKLFLQDLEERGYLVARLAFECTVVDGQCHVGGVHGVNGVAKVTGIESLGKRHNLAGHELKRQLGFQDELPVLSYNHELAINLLPGGLPGARHAACVKFVLVGVAAEACYGKLGIGAVVFVAEQVHVASDLTGRVAGESPVVDLHLAVLRVNADGGGLVLPSVQQRAKLRDSLCDIVLVELHFLRLGLEVQVALDQQPLPLDASPGARVRAGALVRCPGALVGLFGDRSDSELGTGSSELVPESAEEAGSLVRPSGRKSSVIHIHEARGRVDRRSTRHAIVFLHVVLVEVVLKHLELLRRELLAERRVGLKREVVVDDDPVVDTVVKFLPIYLPGAEASVRRPVRVTGPGAHLANHKRGVGGAVRATECLEEGCHGGPILRDQAGRLATGLAAVDGEHALGGIHGRAALGVACI